MANKNKRKKLEKRKTESQHNNKARKLSMRLCY